jgi:AbrB family looped-hinge helix DNA binding protein
VVATSEICKTRVTHRFQTTVPAAIRHRYDIREGSLLAWIPKGDSIEVVPLPREMAREFRGLGRGKELLAALLAYRAGERAT